MSSLFQKNVTCSGSFPGTQMSSRGMQLVTSTGLPSLDRFLGGGLPINSITLIENDEHNQYANMLIRSFIAHGIDNQHEIVILSPTTSSLQSRLLKDLPTLTQQNKDNNYQEDEIKIAWRYKPNETQIQVTEHYDFGNYISDEALNSAKISFVDQNTIFERIKSIANGKNVTKIVIEGLESPLSGFPLNNLVLFVYKLKSLIRSLPNVVCLLSLSAQLILSSDVPFFRSRIQNLVDIVVELVSFDNKTQTPYTEYNGLVNILKLPKINSLNYYLIPETLDLGLKLKKNSRILEIEKLSLPPDLSETVSRTTCSTVNKDLDF